ncbi:hypothetical protein PMAG_a1204 [Pseudoalteromonas mariniglutinosa NCIMB 1770]|nr:hypothetical protein [Pseudoalteromonas mariniglutinosa NCIMB 1770]
MFDLESCALFPHHPLLKLKAAYSWLIPVGYELGLSYYTYLIISL